MRSEVLTLVNIKKRSSLVQMCAYC